MYSHARELIEGGEVNGRLEGNKERASYLPAVQGRAQAIAVRSFFSDNGYIAYDNAHQLGISKPKE